MDVIDRLERSIEQTRLIVAATREDQLRLSTPCSEWTVRDLLNHTIGALVMFRDAADKGAADMNAMAADHVARGAADAYDQASKETLEALRTKGADGTITLPFGELSCEFAYQLVADDVVVHGWDLAQATGQSVAWDQALAEETLAFAQAGLGDPAVRGEEFADPTPCPADADPVTKLVAFLGRAV